ncbi:Aminotransferase, class I/classII [Dillenia turbinata]|uniref:Aminotransferase, class I/classII n=1 Tax=Dillenia turbinata TaxID=194707 RepID=A0AAN8US68_9MAGN
MENGRVKKWGIRGNKELKRASGVTMSSVLNALMSNLNASDKRGLIPMGHGDPSSFPSFRTTLDAENAIVRALQSADFNCYSSTVGILLARRAIAEYLSQDLPYKLSPEDIYLTLGGTHAIEIILTALNNPGANILLPKPGYPDYEAWAAFGHLDVGHFDLLPEKNWELDHESIEALADENTVAVVIINPGNPCGNVYSYELLEKVAKMGRKLGIFVIADEVYDHLVFGEKPFVPMGVCGSMVPVITIGSISKRWIVPGWRLGWIATNDPNGVLQKSGIVECIIGCLNVSSSPVTFIQAALPQILSETKDFFFSKIKSLLRQAANISYDRIKEIPCFDCPQKPEGSMLIMVKLNWSLLEDIDNDLDFCLKLAKEEFVIVLPGIVVGMSNWLRITFAIEPSSLEDGLGRIKEFCQRHCKK